MDSTPIPSASTHHCSYTSAMEQRLQMLEKENAFLRSELVQTRAELLHVTKRKQALEVAAREQYQRFQKLCTDRPPTSDESDQLSSAEIEVARAKAYQKFTHAFKEEIDHVRGTWMDTQSASQEAMMDAIVANMNDLFRTKEMLYQTEIEKLRARNSKLERKCADLASQLRAKEAPHKPRKVR